MTRAWVALEMSLLLVQVTWNVNDSGSGRSGNVNDSGSSRSGNVNHLTSNIGPTQTDPPAKPVPTQTFQSSNISTTTWGVTGVGRCPPQTAPDLARRTQTPVTGPASGRYPPMETLLGPHVAIPTPSPLQKRTTSNTKRTQPVPPLLWGRIGPTLVHAGALPMACAPVAYELSLLLLAAVGGPVCSDVPPSQQCSDSPHHMTIPTPDLVGYWDMSKGCAVAPPLSPDKPTDEDIRIDMSVQ